MKNLITLRSDLKNPEKYSKELSQNLKKNSWIELLPESAQHSEITVTNLPNTSGLIIGSGGSSGKEPHRCLHTCENLNQSAIATREWLKAHELQPNSSLIMNPLPMHHISGLMSWWRSRAWGASHVWIVPSLMHDLPRLIAYCQPFFDNNDGPKLISLVPTQLNRLLRDSLGIQWLKFFTVIWVGGAHISKDTAQFARAEGIPLAPCYGATETAAMVTVMSPSDFLSGIQGCGNPLIDVELSIANDGALKVKTPRLALARLQNGQLTELRDADGWWKSGDIAELSTRNYLLNIDIIGRIDNAINSGGETVFPESLENKLLQAAKEIEIPLEALIFLPIEDKEWGQRLVGVFRWRERCTSSDSAKYLQNLKALTNDWLPAERPVAWHLCKDLAPNAAGKWERAAWKEWLINQAHRVP